MRNATVNPKRKSYLLICEECFEMFESNMPHKQTCNDLCKSRLQNKKAKVYKKCCPWCKCSYDTIQKKQKFCSTDCVAASQKQDAIEKAYYSIPRHIFPSRRARREYIRRKRIRDNFVDDVKLEVLLERDKGICQLCKKKVWVNAPRNHPLEPTNDHIIALANGGEHSYENCQLAHRECNTIKNARIEVQFNVTTQ